MGASLFAVNNGFSMETSEPDPEAEVDVTLQEIEKKDKHSVAKALSEEIERLSETDHMIINTFLQGRSGVLFADTGIEPEGAFLFQGVHNP